jgi:hypothetical protein
MQPRFFTLVLVLSLYAIVGACVLLAGLELVQSITTFARGI